MESEIFGRYSNTRQYAPRAAPDSHRLFRISLQREFSGWIEAAEQIHQFTLDDRDRSPIAIQGIADREVEAEWPRDGRPGGVKPAKICFQAGRHRRGGAATHIVAKDMCAQLIERAFCRRHEVDCEFGHRQRFSIVASR
jgi:hypothetical protein